MKRFLAVGSLIIGFLSGCGPLGTPLTPLGPYPETMRAKAQCSKGEPCAEDAQKKTPPNPKGEPPSPLR